MADYRSEWLRLPSFWSHGVTRDGRVFFIDEEAHRTTWLHPATGEAVISGHRKTPDLPTGWEEGYTFEGARYYIKYPFNKDVQKKVEVLKSECDVKGSRKRPNFGIM